MMYLDNRVTTGQGLRCAALLLLLLLQGRSRRAPPPAAHLCSTPTLCMYSRQSSTPAT